MGSRVYRGARDGRNAARANTGTRANHGAAAPRLAHRSCRLRADQSLGHVDWRVVFNWRRTVDRSFWQPDRVDRCGGVAGVCRVWNECDAECRGDGDIDHAYTRVRTERVVGGQYYDGGALVCAAAQSG